MKTSKLTGAFLAASVAGLFGSTPITATAADNMAGGEVKCAGINGCKGTGGCASAKNACAGQNGCKGQGWMKTSKKECLAKGGKIVEEAKK